MRAARMDPWRMTKLPVDPEERRVARKRGRAARRRTHSCATTTPRVRRAIQASKEKNNVLAKRYGVSRKTIAKWKGRESTSDERMGPKNPSSNSDERMGPKNPSSNILTDDDEAIVLAYRWRTRLSLNDSHERLRRLMPKLSRSALYRCLKRRGLSRIGPTTASPALTPSALRGPYTFEITAHEVVFYHDGIGIVREVFLAVEEITKDVYAAVTATTPENAAEFLARLVAQFPERINAVATYIHPAFTGSGAGFDEDMAIGPHPFAVACRARGITHLRSYRPPMKPLAPKVRSTGVEIRSGAVRPM